MNPSSGELPQFELPPPPRGQAASAGGPAPGQAGQVAAPGQSATPSIPGLPATAAANPLAQAATGKAQSDDNSTTKPTKKPLLEDADLIEKEWVNRAKHIVENTHNDPHKQSQDLTVLKAQYMKQHYGKTIKVDE